MPTRRQFAWGASILSLATGIAVAALLCVSSPAMAGTDAAELAKAGPEGDIALGSETAAVTIIEYASLTCPHCAHFSVTTFPELQKRYIDTGKVRYIFREFPLDPLAVAGFMLARCAGKDKFMPVVQTLFATQSEWMVERPIEPLLKIAERMGFTEDSFNQCLRNRKLVEAIKDVQERAASKLGVDMTPTFFVNGEMLVGDVPIDDLVKSVDGHLDEK
jgi:protein-disulfide isomerase